jgi:single-strand DNA-binding protein
MNKVQIVGRLTKDPELRTTANGVSVCSFTVAVNRRFKNPQGEYEADFINCVAWRNSAELLAKHFRKGNMVGIVGSIQTRNYEKDGSKVYITEVSVEEVHFVESKRSEDKPVEETGFDASMFPPINDEGDDFPF